MVVRNKVEHFRSVKLNEIRRWEGRNVIFDTPDTFDASEEEERPNAATGEETSSANK